MVMWYVYAVCAAIGGTILVCQFAMTVLGLGGDHGDLSGDGHFEVGGHDVGHDAHAHDHVSSNWLFGVITFRTVVAAMAFFGLIGLACISSNLAPEMTLAAAVGAGALAMLSVHQLMQMLHRLSEDPTVRIQSTIGRSGSVYLRIPGQKAGAGKVTIVVQGQSLEFQAMTAGAAISTGGRVQVIGVLDRETVEVEPLKETVEA